MAKTAADLGHHGPHVFGEGAKVQDGLIRCTGHHIAGQAIGPLTRCAWLLADAQVKGIRIVVVQPQLRALAFDRLLVVTPPSFFQADLANPWIQKSSVWNYCGRGPNLVNRR
jgi:hypothetical protein